MFIYYICITDIEITAQSLIFVLIIINNLPFNIVFYLVNLYIHINIYDDTVIVFNDINTQFNNLFAKI